MNRNKLTSSSRLFSAAMIKPTETYSYSANLQDWDNTLIIAGWTLNYQMNILSRGHRLGELQPQVGKSLLNPGNVVEVKRCKDPERYAKDHVYTHTHTHTHSHILQSSHLGSNWVSLMPPPNRRSMSTTSPLPFPIAAGELSSKRISTLTLIRECGI